MYNDGCRENKVKPLFTYFSYTILFTVTSTTQKGLGLRLRPFRNLPVIKIVLPLILAFFLCFILRR